MQLNNITGVGSLTVLEIYDWYDGPRLFSGETNAGIKILVIWVEHNDAHDRWFYIPVSTQRLKDIRSGRVALRTAVLEVQDGWLWEVVTYVAPASATATVIFAEGITSDDLPDEDARLEVDGPLLGTHQELHQQGRDILDVVLNLPSKSPAVDSDVLGDLLKGLQGLFRLLGLGPVGRWTRVPKALAQQHTLQVLTTFESSFGIRMMLKESPVSTPVDTSRTLNHLFSVLSDASNAQKAADIQEEIGHRAFDQLKGVFNSFKDLNAGVALRWLGAEGQFRTYSVDSAQVFSITRVLTQRSFYGRPDRTVGMPAVETPRFAQPSLPSEPSRIDQPSLPTERRKSEQTPEAIPREFVADGVFRLIDTIHHRFVLESRPEGRMFSGVISSGLNATRLTTNQMIRVTLRAPLNENDSEHELLLVLSLQ